MMRELTDTDALGECDNNGDDDADADGRNDDTPATRNSAGLGKAAVRMVRFAGTCAEALMQNLSRLDEEVETEREAVENIVGFVDNIIDSGEFEVVEALISKTKILKWLLYRCGQQYSGDGGDSDGVQAAAADLLAGLLQASETARASLGERGVESILVALSRYRKQHTQLDAEAAETLETLASALCSAMLWPANRTTFTQLDGFELIVILLKVKSRPVRRAAVQILDFALTQNTSGAERLVRVSGGLGIAFAVFMGKLKYLVPSSSSSLAGARADAAEVATRGVGIIFSLFQELPAGVERDRVAAKMVEADYEKCDRLVELYFDLKERIARSVRAIERHAAALGEGETVTTDDVYAARIEGGQYALQQTAVVMAHAYALGHLGIRSRLLLLLHQGNEKLKDVRLVIDSYFDDIGDGDGAEAQAKQRASLRSLQLELVEPEERHTPIDNDIDNT